MFPKLTETLNQLNYADFTKLAKFSNLARQMQFSNLLNKCKNINYFFIHLFIFSNLYFLDSLIFALKRLTLFTSWPENCAKHL